jgi:Trk-type K+ transport system membrane component
VSKKKDRREFAKRSENFTRFASVATAKSSASTEPIPGQGMLGRELANWLFPAFIGFWIVSFLCIKQFGMLAPNGGVRALFISVNAATLTGFRQNPGLGGLNEFGQCNVLLLELAGSLFSMIVGTLAVTRIARLRFSDVEVVVAALIAEGCVLLLGAILPRGADQSFLGNVLTTVSAFGNCGLELGRLPGPSSLLTHVFYLPLTILGGLGLPVLMECCAGVKTLRPLSAHSRMVLTMTGWIFVIGFLLLLGLDFAASLQRRGSWSPISSMEVSSILTIQSRTGGLPIVSIAQTSQAGKWILILLMMIGASSAGTGSGLKTTTLAELFRGLRDLLAGEPGRRSLGIAGVWLGVYLAMVAGSVILLAYVNPSGTSDGLFFNAVSAVSNVGLSTSEIPDEQRTMFAFCAIMLLGRMVPLMILWWMADTTTDGEWGIG